MGSNFPPPRLILLPPPKADYSSFIPFSHLRDVVERQLNPLLEQYAEATKKALLESGYPVRIITSGDNFYLTQDDYFVNFSGSGVTFTAYLPLAKTVKAFVLRVGPSCGLTLKVNPNGTDKINESSTSISPSSSSTTLLFSDGVGWYSK